MGNQCWVPAKRMDRATLLLSGYSCVTHLYVYNCIQQLCELLINFTLLAAFTIENQAILQQENTQSYVLGATEMRYPIT